MAIKVHGIKVKPRPIRWSVLPGVDGFGDHHIGILFGQVAFDVVQGAEDRWYLHVLMPDLGQYYDGVHDDVESAKDEAAGFLAGHLWFILDCDVEPDEAPTVDSESARVFVDICDLFEQAIVSGANENFDYQPDASADRIRSSSDEARRFASALLETVMDPAMANDLLMGREKENNE